MRHTGNRASRFAFFPALAVALLVVSACGDGSEEPTTGISEVSEPTEEPTTGISEVSEPTEEPTTGISEASEPTEEPTTGISEASEPTEEPTTGISEASEPTEEPSESEPVDTAAASGDQPEWANPVTEGGELITTVEVGDITVEAYQMDTATATKDGQFVDPDSNKPLLAEGDEIVFVNYVVTNTGDPIDLSTSLANIEARYDDWPYMQGMDSVVDSALFEQQGVNDQPIKRDAYREPPIYTFGTGQSYSYAENFKYQPGSPITIDVSVTPVDDEGELLHDERVEVEGTGTIS